MFRRQFICLALVFSCCAFEHRAVAEGVLPAENAPAPKTETQTPFDFEYYEEMMRPLPEKEHERLCGLDKICVDLWRKQKMQVYKEGRLFTGDFNSDGVAEEAVILESDDPADETQKLYYIYISNKDSVSAERKVGFHELLPDARNVVDVFVDKEKNALVIDTGGRVVRTVSATTSVGAVGTGFSYATGKVLKVVIVLRWNAKKGKYELICPDLGTGNKPIHLYK